MAADGSINFSRLFRWDANDQGKVGFRNLPVGKQSGQVGMGGIRLSRQDHAGGVLVETVDNPRTLHSANTAKRARTVMQEGMHKGILPGSASRVDNHARGFVNDDQVSILK
jgi:hypothetical protein